MFIKSVFLVFILTICFTEAVSIPLNTSTVSTAVPKETTLSISWYLTAKNTTMYIHHGGSKQFEIIFLGDRTFLEPPTAVSTYVAKRDSSDVATVLSTFTNASFTLAGVTCVVASVVSAGAACILSGIAALVSVILNVLYVSTQLWNWPKPRPPTRRDLLIN